MSKQILACWLNLAGCLISLYLLLLEKMPSSSAKIKGKSISNYHCIIPYFVQVICLHFVCLFSFNFLSKHYYIIQLMMNDVTNVACCSQCRYWFISSLSTSSLYLHSYFQEKSRLSGELNLPEATYMVNLCSDMNYLTHTFGRLQPNSAPVY